VELQSGHTGKVPAAKIQEDENNAEVTLLPQEHMQVNKSLRDVI